MERSYMKSIGDMNGKKVDIIHLYGTDGVGGVGTRMAVIPKISSFPPTSLGFATT